MKGLLVVLLLLATGDVPPDPTVKNEAGKRLIEFQKNRNYTDAIAELRATAVKGPQQFRDTDQDYRLARVEHRDGQLAASMAGYQSVTNRGSDTAPYALRHIAELARSTGNLELERVSLLRSTLEYPEGIPTTSCRYRLAESSIQAGNFGQAVDLLTSNPPSAKVNGIQRHGQVMLGYAYLGAGRSDVARQIFTALAADVAHIDDASAAAVKGLDIIDGGSDNLGKRVPDISAAEHLQRAAIYQANRDFGNAKLHYEAVIAADPGGPNAADSSYQIGRGFTQLGQHVEALNWYERILEQYPQSTSAKDALLQAASAYARVGKHKEAIKRYQHFIDLYPTDDKLDRAYLNIVDIYRDQGEDQEAIKWCQKTQASFTGRVADPVAIFAETRVYLSKSDWPNALNDLERLRTFSDLGGTTPGGTDLAEITFLRGFVLEQMGRYQDSIDAYLAVPDGRESYYGWQSAERLQALSGNETAASFISQKTGAMAADLKAKDADTRRHSALGILRSTQNADLRARAIEVLKPASKPAPPPDPSANGVVGELLALGLDDDAYREGPAAHAITGAEAYWRKMPADYPVESMSHDQLVALYPSAFEDEVVRYAALRKVDPRFVLAIMRQESRFQTDARSGASARGLMQLISTTAQTVGGEVGRGNIGDDDLFDSDTSVFLATQYLSDLFKIFPESPEAVAASYNAGDDNVRRWVSRAKSNSPDRYLPEMMFAETKDYVRRVMTNYRMYQQLYDEQLRAK